MAEKLRRTILLQLTALMIGVGSGAIANFIGMPLPWMLGAMIGTTICAMIGVPMHSPAVLRPGVIPVLGVLLGSSLTLEVLKGAASWLPSISLMPLYVVSVTLLCMQVYIRLGGYSRPSAFFSSMPGGLNEMILLSVAYGGDERRVALAHGLRLLLTICLIGLIYGLVLHVSSSGGRNWTALDALTLADYLWLGGAALFGGLIGAKSRIPAGVVLVPMLISGALHITEVVTVPPPSALVIGAQAVMGTSVGARFFGVKLREILPDLALGAVSTLVMLGVALLFCLVLISVSDTDIAAVFLAFSPGGLSEMSLLALALGHAVTYVTVLHVFRIMVVLIFAPALYRLIGRKD